MTQNKFVTRILLIFQKSLMMLSIPAEWLIYMEMIQKLSMLVSHMYIVVIHLTAVSSYKYQHEILIGFLELNQGLACQVINAQIHVVPLLNVLVGNFLFSLNNYNVHVIH